jgi:hypothetical protein
MFKNLNTKILASVFLLVCVVIVTATFTIAPLNKIALALTGNYSKTQTAACTTPGSQLCITDWNNLPSDFVAKSGGNDAIMTGPLTLPGDPTQNNQAATKRYVDNAIVSVSSPMTNVGGQSLRMVCGITPVTAVNTVQYDASTLRIDIDTSSASFNTIAFYYSSLSAVGGSHYKVTSANSIYNPTNSGFRLYLHFDDYNNNMGGVISLANAVGWGWTINWCGIGT